MRFIHTADWHLGRQLHGVNLTEDQAFLLGQFVELVRAERPDAVLIAGDIYDRSVPPRDAVALLDDVLARLVLELGVRVVLIAGNHDGPDRLQFGARLMAQAGLTVVGTCGADIPRVELRDDAGPVAVYALPYLEPLMVRHQLADDEIHDHDAALGAMLARLRASRDPGERAMLLTHAYVTGGEPTPESSERPLTLGGSGEVRREHVDGFSYVALGHLHRPQQVGDPSVRYAGSLMKYAVAEADQRKSVSLVELDAAGGCRVEAVALSPRRDLRCLRGTLHGVLDAADADPGREDYLHVTLTDEGALLDPMSKLREAYPNVLGLAREFLQAESAAVRPDHRTVGAGELFAAFFTEATGAALTGEEAAEFARVADAVQREAREEAPV